MAWSDTSDGTFGRSIPARYGALLGNPKTRAQVPTKYLSPSQQKERLRIARTRALQQNPYSLQNQISSPSLQKTARSLVQAELGPGVSELNQQIAKLRGQSDYQTQRAGAYYKQLADQVAPSVQNATTAAGSLASQIAGIGRDQQATINEAQGAAQRRTTADEAVRGIGLDADTSQRLAREFALQKGIAATNTSIQENLGGAVGEAGINTARTRAEVLPLQGLREQQNIRQQYSSQIEDRLIKRAAIEATRGPKEAAALADLGQKNVENAFAYRTLVGKEQTANVNALAKTPAGVSATTQARSQATTAAKYGYTSHQWALLGPRQRATIIQKKNTNGSSVADRGQAQYGGYSWNEYKTFSRKKQIQVVHDYKVATSPSSKKPGQSDKWLTPLQQNDATTKSRTATKWVTDPDNLKKYPKKEDLITQVSAQAKIPPVLVQAAYEAQNDGFLSSDTIQKLINGRYKPRVIARALGTKTAGEIKKNPSGVKLHGKLPIQKK